MSVSEDELAKFQSAFMNEIYFQDNGFHPFLADEKYQPNMGIYINNCRLILGNILKDKYPYCAQIIGDDFEHYSSVFVKQHHLEIGNVTLYGYEFADFLADNDFGEITKLLSDLAKIEWAKYLCELAPFEKHLDFNAFNGEIAKNGGQNIMPTQSLKIIDCQTNAFNLFQCLKSDCINEFVFSEIAQKIILWQGRNFEISMMIDDGVIHKIIENMEQQNITDAIDNAISHVANTDQAHINQAQANFAYACENGLFIGV